MFRVVINYRGKYILQERVKIQEKWENRFEDWRIDSCLMRKDEIIKAHRATKCVSDKKTRVQVVWESGNNEQTIYNVRNGRDQIAAVIR